jgi:uncharacterized membrane protein
MDTVPPPPPSPSAQPVAPATAEDKTVAIVAYLTLIGFVVAVVIHGSKKTRLGAYHLRQALGLMLTGMACGIIGMIPILGWILIFPLMLCLFVLWIIGLMAAAGGQLKPVPVLGAHYQKWFGTAFE